MKKTLLLLIIVAFAATVNGQTSEKKWGVGAALGAYGTLNNGGIGLMPEGYFLSRYLSPRLDLVFQGDLGMFRSNNTQNDLNFANGLLNLRFKLSDESKNFRPYIYGGPGVLSVNTGSGSLRAANKSILNFDLGLGGKYYVSPSTAFYMETGYIHGLETTIAGVTERESYWKATVGLERAFGKSKDTDMDGVSDKKDKSPDTPTGVAVDANGYPVDTDGDGVADYIDDCLTVAGLTSMKGCPDTDKDGIADKDDKCTATPKGWKVDASGCPLDQDKDGIVDSEDGCPTVAGPKENKGCPVKEEASAAKVEAAKVEAAKLKVDPVYFDPHIRNYIVTEKTKIEKLVSLLKENPNYNVNITGYADSTGNENSNLILSKNRVSSVVKTIAASGIEMNRIASQQEFGIANPAATNETEEGRALNRRVEFEVIKTK